MVNYALFSGGLTFMSTGLKNGHHATYGIIFYVNSACVLNSKLHCIRNPLRI